MTQPPYSSTSPARLITLYATSWCDDCRRATRWFDAHGLPYVYINIDQDARAAAHVLRINGGMRSVPTIVFPNGSVLVEPSAQQLAQQVTGRVTPAHPLAQADRGTSDRLPEQYLSKWPASMEPGAAWKDAGHVVPTTRSATMSNDLRDIPTIGAISFPRFASVYNRLMSQAMIRLMFDPLRHATAGQAHGLVLEVGAGGGQNFPFYDPARVLRVEAIEPDIAMLAAARQGQATALVPIGLSRAAVEAIPFPDAAFDSAVVTLVFCSVREPLRGLSELWRVLKPGGSVFFLEHVRAEHSIVAGIQDALVPLTTRCMGNCHWNRNTLQAIQEIGFQTLQINQVSGGLQPMLYFQARRPETPQTSPPVRR
jgi:ubiquinone/menaquinone biosynthesis C-methylase UbiE/glutaredoxin